MEKQFAVHDYVYVNNGQIGQFEESDDDKQFWIARVLEVRASGPTSVYLRVYWLYWPSELPDGAASYHGKSELVASNHMEIIDATTVSDKADVLHLLEQEDAPTVTGLYWRQKFDYTSKRLSVSREDVGVPAINLLTKHVFSLSSATAYATNITTQTSSWFTVSVTYVVRGCMKTVSLRTQRIGPGCV